MKPFPSAALAAVLFLLPSTVRAQVPMVGVFTAEATCAATPSIRSDRNPGDIATEAGRSYELIGRNAVPGSHYLIVIPEADPDRRWVAYGCGTVGEGTSVGEAPRPVPPGRVARGKPAATKAGRYVLAASWQAAFCETRPRVTECRRGGRDDLGFTLHGLWPQPQGHEYCEVSPEIVAIDEDGDWQRLPDFDLSDSVREDLSRVMPGVASGLDRHEWWTHGTCAEGDAEAYFAASIRLIDALNASAVRDLFEASVGDELSGRQIRAAFDEAFGRGAGDRVLVDCAEADGRRLIGEIRIELAGTVSPQTSLGDLILAASPVQPGCRAGEIDAAGF